MENLENLLNYLFISFKDNKFIIILKNNLLLNIEQIKFKKDTIYVKLDSKNLELNIIEISKILNFDYNNINQYYITDENEMKLGLKGLWLEIFKDNK